MPKRKLIAQQIIAGIRAATAAWNAPQDTDYYADKWHVAPATMATLLHQLEAEGLVTRSRARAYARFVDTWTVTEDTP